MERTIDEIKYQASCIYYGTIVPEYLSSAVSPENFKSLYGLSVYQTAVTWDLIIQGNEIEHGYEIKHLLWTLFF